MLLHEEETYESHQYLRYRRVAANKEVIEQAIPNDYVIVINALWSP
jgi:hypothetical protein